MGKSYTFAPKNSDQTVAKARGSDLRVSFKNTREVGRALHGMPVVKAQRYLKDVIDHKQIVPFRIHNRGTGRHAQMKQFKAVTGRWPQKSCKFLIDLLVNAQANAEVLGLDQDNLKIAHIQVQRAAQGRRRTYRAHGRINPYMNCPCHVEIVLTEKAETVSRPVEDFAAKTARVPHRSSKVAHFRRLSAAAQE